MDGSRPGLDLDLIACNYIKLQYYRTRDELKQARTIQEKYDRELKKKNGELRQASHIVDNLQQEDKRSKDTISSLQNKLINVHQQLELLEDAKKLSDQPSARTKDTYQNQYYRTQDDSDLKQTRDELKQTRAVLEKYDRELKRKNGELRQVSQIIDNLQQENKRSKDTISSLQNELINVHQQLEDAKNLSEVHETELVDSSSPAILTKADTLSISEVGEKVTALNEEIFQAAATLGEALVRKRPEVSQTDLNAAAVVSQEMIGEKMTKLLIAQSQKQEPEFNPLLVQVVLQIFLVRFCVSKIQSWYSGDPAVGEILSAIYSQIRSTEEKEVSGRWRVLTRAHTRPGTTETWIEELYQKLQDVFEIASWAPRSPEIEKSRLPSIFKAINELRLAIGEKFTSADLHIFVFEYDQIYDPAIMEDAYGDDRQSSGIRAPEAIVGTTGIGLAKVIEAEHIVKDSDVPQFQTLIPAKNVLRSTLNDALEPIQSTTLKKNKSVENMDGANQDGRD